MDGAILVLNTGPSGIKFALYTALDLVLLYHGQITNVFEKPRLIAFNQTSKPIMNEAISFSGYESSLTHLFDWLRDLPNRFTLKAVGHRIVHGGIIFQDTCLLTKDAIENIGSLIPLAPQQLPLNIAAINSVMSIYPELPQVACFGTSFHRAQEKLATEYVIARHTQKLIRGL